MPHGISKGRGIARSDDTVVVGRDHDVPREAVDAICLQPSTTRAFRALKSDAHDHHGVVDGEADRDAAGDYRAPSPEAECIRDRIAVWRAVEVAP